MWPNKIVTICHTSLKIIKKKIEFGTNSMKDNEFWWLNQITKNGDDFHM